MKRNTVLVAAWLALGASQALAQDARLIGTIDRRVPQYRTVAGILESMSCNVFWVSKAVTDSGIALASFDRPPDGQKIILKNVGDCAKTPPPEVAERSRALLARPAPKPRVVALGPKKPAADYQAQLAAKQKEFEEKLAEEKGQADARVKELSDKHVVDLANLKASLLPPPSPPPDRTLLFQVGGGSFLAGLLVMGAAAFFWKKKATPGSARVHQQAKP